MASAVQWKPEADSTYRELMDAAAKSIANRRRDKKAKSGQAKGLFKQGDTCVLLLMEHPFDAKATMFEAYAQNRTPGAYLVFWYYGPRKNEITIVAITPHP